MLFLGGLIILFYGLAVGLSMFLKTLQPLDGQYTRREWLWISLLFPIVGPLVILIWVSIGDSASTVTPDKKETISWVDYKRQFVEYLTSIPIIADIVHINTSQGGLDILKLLKAIEWEKAHHLDFSLYYLICDQLVNVIEKDVLTNKMLCQKLSQHDKDEISALYCHCLNLPTKIDFQKGIIQFTTE